MQDRGGELRELARRLYELGGFLDLPAKRESLKQLQAESAEPGLWDDPQKAQVLTRRVARLSSEVEEYERLEALVSDVQAANDMAMEADDAELEAEVTEGLERLRSQLDSLEVRTLFSGELDDHDAILSIHAGEGGTEAQDWAEMLLRMYLRWAEVSGFQAQVREALAGEEAGVKSATVEVRGANAYGWLSSEHGVHRLVRMSPFDSANRRHTSHASVDVIPDFGEQAEIEVDPEELHIETFRAGGPGGQYVNTTDSAVRITHLPTKLQASCQSERSQLSNKIVAMKLLTSRLAELRRQEREKELAGLRGEQKRIGFGSRIRSYVLHPYQMVKDERTGYESSNVERILDGALEPVMTSYLRWKAGPPQDGSS
ncbi:MAG TPA: peptide chain release factor 2 [Actinomycetota bacterium]|nr:peptide chain release factor 2 [Actinomycetota bacterium]